MQKLSALLFRAFDGKAVVRVQNPFAALDASEPEPDVAVVPIGDYDTAHPDVAHPIVEVAESSLRRDRGLKLGIYAECGVPEYWIVNLVDRRIEVYTEPDGHSYGNVRHHSPGESIQLTHFPEIRIAVRDVIK